MCALPYLELNLEPMLFYNGALWVLPGNRAGLGAGVLATARGDENRMKGAGRQPLRGIGSFIAKPQQRNSHELGLQCRGAPEASLSPRGLSKNQARNLGPGWRYSAGWSRADAGAQGVPRARS